MQASEVKGVFKELTAIANAVPYAPYDSNQEISDALSGDRIPGRAGVRDWFGESERIISATKGFLHFPLSEIATRKVAGARRWFEGDALKFARHVADILRWIVRWGIAPTERQDEKIITTFETALSFNRTKFGWSLELDSPIETLYRNFYACLKQADPLRVRACRKCSRIFYAKRSDQNDCSTVCARRLRSRQWYEKKGRKLRGYKKR
ncbi:MAG TPA: hypothetical protein VMV15_07485 [Candidatus Binataceae bacterium]|nr:hypothetical protein [Candidatus Binataceae bacterium]